MASRAQWQLIPILLTIWAVPIWAQGGQQDAVRGQVANPHGHLTLACEGCHTTTAWRPVRRVMEFDHNAQTSFALRGMHQSVPCTGCHVDLVFSKAPTECAECHADLHRRQFGANCQQCHTVLGWNVQVSATQGHDNRFPLLGAHAAVICDQCHRGAAGGVFTGLSTQCVSCHQKDFQTATTPLNHVAAGLPTTCEACHNSMNSWQQQTRFDHTQFAHFALAGVHASLQCQQCHVGNRYAGTPAACIGCHMNDYTTATPDHRAAKFPQDCSGCHTTTTWLNATFDHTATGFALTGAHTTVACAQCHVNNNYALSSAACWNCHQNDYNSATNPNHKAAGFSQDCTGCHNTTSWAQFNPASATFNHATSTGFALTNAHASLQCTDCHNSQFGNYSIPSGACANCHMKDYNGTTSPPHAAAGFPTTCDTCHTTVAGWGGGTFAHPTSPLALTGYHATMLAANQCTYCHTGATPFTATPYDCWSCHQYDYNILATNPPHAAQSFPHDCSGCHTFVDWSGATFNHAATGFALTGAHTTQACSACHTPTVGYNIQSSLCYNCHSTEYNSTTNPPHQMLGLPYDCSFCHSTNVTNPPWAGAAFTTHPTAPLALTGYHATMLANNQCGSCHVGNNYTTTPSDCWSCHSTIYNQTSNPGHAAANFAHTCDSCHNFTSWAGAQYLAHDTKDFRIYALPPPHAGYWQNCSDCHTSSTDYTKATLTCFTGTCHPQAATNSVPAHIAAGSNYSYVAPICINCHTR